MIQVKIWENYRPCKKLPSKLENKSVKDYCEDISTSEIRNLKITNEVNLFRSTPRLEFDEMKIKNSIRQSETSRIWASN